MRVLSKLRWKHMEVKMYEDVFAFLYNVMNLYES